jgi:hypothetical protein
MFPLLGSTIPVIVSSLLGAGYENDVAIKEAITKRTY